MIRIKDILKEIEAYAPLPLQEGFDNAGVQVGDVNQPAQGALLCLDVTEEVIDEALELDCNLIISHHPLAFKAFKSLEVMVVMPKFWAYSTPSCGVTVSAMQRRAMMFME